MEHGVNGSAGETVLMCRKRLPPNGRIIHRDPDRFEDHVTDQASSRADAIRMTGIAPITAAYARQLATVEIFNDPFQSPTQGWAFRQYP